HLDEQAALDRAEKRDAVERRLALEVRDALVQITGGAAEGDRRLEQPSAAPLPGTRPAGNAANADDNPTIGRGPVAPFADGGDAAAKDREGGVGVRVFSEQEARDDRPSEVIADGPAQRRIDRGIARVRAEDEAGAPAGADERRERRTRISEPPREPRGRDEDRQQPQQPPLRLERDAAGRACDQRDYGKESNRGHGAAPANERAQVREPRRNEEREEILDSLVPFAPFVVPRGTFVVPRERRTFKNLRSMRRGRRAAIRARRSCCCRRSRNTSDRTRSPRSPAGACDRTATRTARHRRACSRAG